MKKAGQIILEHDLQRLDLEDDIIEYRRKMEADIVKTIHKVIEQSKNLDIYKNKDFYIVYTFTTDRVLRQPKPLVWARRSCPTPVYKQNVFKYHHQAGTYEFLWSIPDALQYMDIITNAPKYLQEKENHELVKFCLLMESGELLEWVKKENGNKKDAVILLNRDIEALTLF